MKGTMAQPKMGVRYRSFLTFIISKICVEVNRNFAPAQQEV